MSINSHKHQTFKPYVPRVYGNRYCLKQTLIRGELHTCGEPTEGGKNHCERCAMRLITLLDRKLALAESVRAAKGHPWAEESFDFATRKKRRRQAA